jgi:hypothetical protein
MSMNNEEKRHKTEEEPASSAALSEESLLELIRSTENMLQTAPSSSADHLFQEVASLVAQSELLETYHANVEALQQDVDAMIRSANARQLDYLVKKLNDTLLKEMKLRTNSRTNLVEGPATVSTDSLIKKFDAKQIMAESEEELQEWVMDIIQEELYDYVEEQINESGEDCATPVDVVHKVQSALTKYSQDGIGITDHAQGARVVYEMTSDSYSPPPDRSELLGNVWWRKYIPEDWERILPEGWQAWNVGIPSYVYHSLVRSRLFWSFSFSSGCFSFVSCVFSFMYVYIRA